MTLCDRERLSFKENTESSHLNSEFASLYKLIQVVIVQQASSYDLLCVTIFPKIYIPLKDI